MSVGTGVRIPRDRFHNPYRPEGATMTSGQTCTEGWNLARSAAGTLQVATEVPGLLPGGFATRDIVTADPNGNDTMNAETGLYSVDMSQLAGDAFVDTSPPGPIYWVDNQLFGALAANPATGAARSIAGLFLRLDRAPGTTPATTTKCLAWLGPEGFAMAMSLAGAKPIPTYNAVITTIAAYTGTLTGTLTGSVNGAIGAQDTGVTLTPGMRVFLPVITGGAGGATVAADSGPYLVVSPGASGAKFVLTRPPEWYQGAIITPDATFRIDNVGTLWGGSEWKSLPATDALLVGTGDPAFWPRTYSADLTVAGANTTMWMRNTKAISGVNKTSINGWWASTLTAGAGNGAVTITGTAADHVEFTAINW